MKEPFKTRRLGLRRLVSLVLLLFQGTPFVIHNGIINSLFRILSVISRYIYSTLVDITQNHPLRPARPLIKDVQPTTNPPPHHRQRCRPHPAAAPRRPDNAPGDLVPLHLLLAAAADPDDPEQGRRPRRPAGVRAVLRRAARPGRVLGVRRGRVPRGRVREPGVVLLAPGLLRVSGVRGPEGRGGGHGRGAV